MTKDQRIDKELRRLKKIYKDISKDKIDLIDGIIQRAAYMRITLEDYEADLDENGYVELFSQSDKMEPYERERPVARLYNTMNNNYQKIMKQLTDLLPKDGGGKERPDDPLMGFIKS
ncbi:hypothetical protein [Paenibacillus rhizolycopersici]|uniref:hypothetical protein n=1 Tax=Paenibacillus rhizolycopersici TaxID=2780073 RepID=UPI003D2C13EF